jgi:hypothetical protein
MFDSLRFSALDLKLGGRMLVKHPELTGAKLALILAMCVSGGREVLAQSLRVPQGASEAQIVAAAHADGEAYPRFLTTAPRDALPRRCVAAWEIGPAQSGEFTIGGNLAGSVAMRAGRPGKVWWAPLHYAADMPPLVVRGRSLTTPSDTLIFTTAKIAWPVTPGGPRVPPAQRKYFFPSGITIPGPGRWLLIATSGPNWGCFILTVT